MSDVLDSFLKAKGLIKEEKVEKKSNKKIEKVIDMPIIVDNSITLHDIIEEKPSKKKVIQFLKERMEEYEKEFLD